jgi:hypothetical protein
MRPAPTVEQIRAASDHPLRAQTQIRLLVGLYKTLLIEVRLVRLPDTEILNELRDQMDRNSVLVNKLPAQDRFLGIDRCRGREA